MRRFWLFSAIVIVFLVAPRALWAELVVELMPSATVKAKGIVKLGDIAEVSGDALQIESALQASILVAPKAGLNKSVDAGYVKRKLESIRLKNIRMQGAQQIVVEGECTRIAPDEILEHARTYIAENLPTPSNGTYNINTLREPDELVLPAGDSVELTAKMMFGEPKIGSNYVLIDAVVDGKQIKTARVGMKVSLMVDALVVTSSLRKGDVISPQNTSIAQVEAAHGKAYLDVDVLEGNESLVCTRTLMPGTAVCVGDVTSQVAVKRGDKVTLVVKCGSVKLATVAQAKQDGCRGDNITVRSEVSTGDVQATVVEPGLVQIVR